MADPTTAVPNVGDLAWDGAKWQRWNGSAWQDITLTDTRFDQYSYVSMNPDGSIDAVLRDGGPDEHIVGGTSVDKKPSTAVAANAYTLPALSDDAIWKAAGYTKPDWWPAGEQAPFTKEVDDKGKPTGTFLLDKDHVKFVQDEVNRKTAEAKAAAAAAKTTAYPATNLAKTAAEVEAAIAKGKADGSLKGNYVVGYDAGSNGYYMKEVPPTVVDSLNTMIDKALIAKDWDQARRLDDFRQRPSPAQVMDLAIKYASSPADYFSLLGMARGEIAIDPAKAGQALREVGRVAPNAPFLDAAWKQVFGAAYPNQAGTGGAVTDPSIPPGMVKDAAGNLIPAPGLEFGPNGVLQQKAPSVAANQGAPQAPFTVPGAQTAFDRGGGTRGALTTVDQGAAQAGAGMTFAQPGAQLNNIAAGQGNPPESQGGPPLMTFGAPANVQLGPQNQTPEQAALQGAGISPEATGLRPYYANTPAGQQPGVNAPHNFLSPSQLAQANYGMISQRPTAPTQGTGESDADFQGRQAQYGREIAALDFDYGPSGGGRAQQFAAPAGQTPGDLYRQQAAGPGYLPYAVRQVGIQGGALGPVAHQFPEFGSLRFPSGQAWENMLPAERQVFQRTIENQGIPWEDYQAEMNQATRFQRPGAGGGGEFRSAPVQAGRF